MADQNNKRFHADIKEVGDTFISEMQEIIKSLLKDFVEDAKSSKWGYSPSKVPEPKKIYFAELKGSVWPISRWDKVVEEKIKRLEEMQKNDRITLSKTER